MFDLIRWFWHGRRLANSVLSGEFDDSRFGRRFTAWFEERPERSKQREMFVQLMLHMGAPKGRVADRVMDCIMGVWRHDGAVFGDLLAKQLDELVVFAAPKDGEQKNLQLAAKEELQRLQARLRALDR
jgi:hypothetical protein